MKLPTTMSEDSSVRIPRLQRVAALVLVIAGTAGLTGSARSLEPGQEPVGAGEISAWVEVLGRVDGTFEWRSDGLHTAELQRAAAAATQSLGLVDAPFDEALVRHQSRWGTDSVDGGYTRAVRENFNTTKELGPKERKVVDRALSDYNENKGHASAPMFKRRNKKQALTGGNPNQLDADGQSTFAKTADDRFFVGEDPDVLSRAKVFLRGTLVFQGGGVIRANLNISEADIYMRSDFFKTKTQSALNQRLEIFRMLHFSMGHTGNTWTHDLGSVQPDHIDQVALDDFTSLTWQQKRASDALLYGADTAVRVRGADTTLAPMAGSVIRIDGLGPPPFNPGFSNRDNAEQYLDFIRTEKKGFSQKKRLTVEVFKGNKTNNKNRLVKIGGASIDRNFPIPNLSAAIIFYTRASARFGQHERSDELQEAVRKAGKPCTIGGVSYDRCLDVTIRAKGFVEENAQQSSEQDTYTLVMNENES